MLTWFACLAILLGKKWKAETAETKAHFKALADEVKRKHAEQHPNYQYAPRKPSEKKRRSTARRGAASAGKPMVIPSDSSTRPSVNNEFFQPAIETDACSLPVSHTPISEEDTPLLQPSPTQNFEDLLQNHTHSPAMGLAPGNFLGLEHHNSPKLSVSVPPLFPTENATVLSNEVGDGNAYAWNTLEFDFDDYFIGAAG